MKKTDFFRVIVAIIMIFVCSLPSFAYDFIYNDIAYNIIDEEQKYVEVTKRYQSGKPYSTIFANVDLVLPSEVEYNGVVYTCTQIGEYAFGESGFDSMSSVTIPNSVIKIGPKAFRSCYNLLSVVIPSNVISIEEEAFCQSHDIVKVTLPENLQSMGHGVFKRCTSLVTIVSKNLMPPTICSDTFDSTIYQNATLNVYDSCLDNYMEAVGWTNFAKTTTLTQKYATSLAVNPLELSLNTGESALLSVEFTPANTTDKSVVWFSSDNAIVVVDQLGNVKAVGEGEAFITATTTDGSNMFATCCVTVKAIQVKSLTLDKHKVSLNIGNIQQLRATILPQQEANSTIVWSSSDDSVAVVDQNGVVTAKGVGKVMITALVESLDLMDTCEVSVVPTCGDVNVDGKVNVSDIVLIVNIILNGGNIQQKNIDNQNKVCNDDIKITVDDLMDTMLENVVFTEF